MKKIAVLFAVLAVVVGCSNDNKITLNNISGGTIYFNFLAVGYEIGVDSTQIIPDIPNGTYTYATTFGIPSGAKTISVIGTAASGELAFEKKDTQVRIIYSGYVTQDSVYQVGATITSTTPMATASPTSP